MQRVEGCPPCFPRTEGLGSVGEAGCQPPQSLAPSERLPPGSPSRCAGSRSWREPTPGRSGSPQVQRPSLAPASGVLRRDEGWPGWET